MLVSDTPNRTGGAGPVCCGIKGSGRLRSGSWVMPWLPKPCAKCIPVACGCIGCICGIPVCCWLQGRGEVCVDTSGRRPELLLARKPVGCSGSVENCVGRMGSANGLCIDAGRSSSAGDMNWLGPKPGCCCGAPVIIGIMGLGLESLHLLLHLLCVLLLHSCLGYVVETLARGSHCPTTPVIWGCSGGTPNALGWTDWGAESGRVGGRRRRHQARLPLGVLWR